MISALYRAVAENAQSLESMTGNLPFPVHQPDEGDDDSVIFDITSDEFCSDEFRMYEFKVRRCPKQKPHDWTQCPFAHCGERATRRDPRLFAYSGAACGEFRRTGTCSRGDLCPYAHGVFECWLHPSKYKTQMCSDVKFCKRPVCFFAHSPQELRTPTQTGVPKSMHMHVKREVPQMNRMMPSVNVEQIAAEVEKLLGQKTGTQSQSTMHSSFIPPASGQPASQNAISSFLNSVVQLQNAVPGINVLQLLQAVGAPQEQGQALNNTHHPGMPHNVNAHNVAAQMDLKAALAQAQLQMNLQNQAQNMQGQQQMANDFVRHPSWSTNRSVSMDNPTGSLPGPLTSFDNTFSPRAGSLNAFSGPFSGRNSTSSACSLPVISAPGPAQSQVQSSSALGIGSSGLCNKHTRGDIPVDWATIDNEVGAGHIGSGSSDRSTTGGDTTTSEAPESGGLWACEEFLCPSQSTDRSQLRAGQMPGQLSGPHKSVLKNDDDLHGLKCMDPLLDALPRDLSEMAQGITTD